MNFGSLFRIAGLFLQEDTIFTAPNVAPTNDESISRKDNCYDVTNKK